MAAKRKLAKQQAAKIRVGIWGLGRAGYGMHVPELLALGSEFEIVAGCDVDPARLEALGKRIPGAVGYEDGDAFLADPNVELVAVAVRSTQHVDYAIRALKAGKYVMAEKPFALTLQGARKLAREAARHPGRLFVRHNRRLEPAFNHVQEIIASGILGEVYEIKLCRHNYQFRGDWQTLADCGGGQLNNWGPHLVDQALRLLESPVESLWSDLKNVAALGDAEDHLKLVFRGRNGRVVDVEISGGVALSSPVYAIYGTRGSLVSDDEQDIRLRYLDPAFKGPARGTANPGTPSMGGGFGGDVAPKWIRKTIMVEPANGANMNAIYHAVFMAIRHQAPYPISIEEAVEVVRWTEQAKRQNPAFKLVSDVYGIKTLA